MWKWNIYLVTFQTLQCTVPNVLVNSREKSMYLGTWLAVVYFFRFVYKVCSCIFYRLGLLVFCLALEFIIIVFLEDLLLSNFPSTKNALNSLSQKKGVMYWNILEYRLQKRINFVTQVYITMQNFDYPFSLSKSVLYSQTKEKYISIGN